MKKARECKTEQQRTGGTDFWCCKPQKVLWLRETTTVRTAESCPRMGDTEEIPERTTVRHTRSGQN